jgi:type IV secretion system protein VirB11
VRSLRPYLSRPEITELCINRPCEIFLETGKGWTQENLPFADFDWCRRFARLVANATCQRIDEESPLLSASLPGGERIQVVIPPATTKGCVSITIRKPSARAFSLQELALAGLFRATRCADGRLDATDQELLDLLKDRAFEAFMRRAVLARKNIVISGPTGSGKTTYTKALIREIPSDERLITIEDTAELVLDSHANHVRLFYSKDDQGLARATPRQLLESCLRMRPDRILLAELRGEEAFDYLRGVNSGHPGSITSVHAGSCELAFEQLTLLVKQSRAGSTLKRSDIRQLLDQLIDIVIQCGRNRHERSIQEIYFDPHRKHRALAAAI